VNVAFNKNATSSSALILGNRWWAEACKAVNGRTTHQFNAMNCIHTSDNGPWWEVDLQQTYTISGISIHRRDGDTNANPPDLPDSNDFKFSEDKFSL
jgi:hypothetical protein